MTTSLLSSFHWMVLLISSHHYRIWMCMSRWILIDNTTLRLGVTWPGGYVLRWPFILSTSWLSLMGLLHGLATYHDVGVMPYASPLHLSRSAPTNYGSRLIIIWIEDLIFRLCSFAEAEIEIHFIFCYPSYYKIRGRFHCLYRECSSLTTFFAYMD